MTKHLVLCILVVTIFRVTYSARILGVFPMPAKSHYILGSALMRGLAEKGHDVTVISAFGEKDPPKNYRDIVLSGLVEKMEDRRKSFNMFDNSHRNPFIFLPFIMSMMTGTMDQAFGHPAVQEFIKSDSEKFDVVIVEQFLDEAFHALAHHFKAPLILFSTVGANAWVNEPVGNPGPPSYVPEALMAYSDKMCFLERMHNSLFNVFHRVLQHVYSYPQQNKILHKYLPEAPHVLDVIYNTSLVLLNSHVSTSFPVPHVPSMIEIGGFHVRPSGKLPKDLQKYLDEAKDGVIYFSMGSNLRSSQLPAEKRQALLNVFGKLKEKVIWKWEEDELPGQPSNVKLGKWLPQQDILAHPNIKLFITHGGLLSTTETIYHGVPVLAIPVAADQNLNAQMIEKSGFGLSIPYNQLTELILQEKLSELLRNPKYRETAKRKSEIFHDRPQSPMETAVFWVEYVIRHKGAPHLQVAGKDLPWYKYLLLDVVGFLLSVVASGLFVSYVLVKKLLKCRSGRKQNKTSKVQSKSKKDKKTKLH